ncbi:hypothetical protein [Aeromicrobium sp. Root344]|uniref:hypothetical protein n=1 Tax=Aeromicrobium sp. Root344 TaxID=1736521 RepID=UPI001F3357A2|nr:hypothetical protein [Aeromicrobium sp. Root344]
MATLLDADLVRATGRVDKVLAMEGPAAARLHAYLQADIAAVLTLSYDVRGLYNDVVLELPELRTQAQRRSAIHDGTARLVAQGVESGDLDVDLDPEFVQHAITGLLLEAVRQRGSQPAGGSEERALAIADFVLRATLAVPSDLPRIRAVAGSLVAALDPGVAGQSLLAPGQAH